MTVDLTSTKVEKRLSPDPPCRASSVRHLFGWYFTPQHASMG